MEAVDVQTDESKQILIAITKLQENVKNMNEKMDEIGKISTLVHSTEQSTKSAHNRINDLKTDFDKALKDQKDDYEEKLRDQKDNFKELKGHITWLWRAVGTGGIAFLFWLLQQNWGGQ